MNVNGNWNSHQFSIVLFYPVMKLPRPNGCHDAQHWQQERVNSKNIHLSFNTQNNHYTMDWNDARISHQPTTNTFSNKPKWNSGDIVGTVGLWKTNLGKNNIWEMDIHCWWFFSQPQPVQHQQNNQPMTMRKTIKIFISHKIIEFSNISRSDRDFS